jgi:putative MATE family efflux protein
MSSISNTISSGPQNGGAVPAKTGDQTDRLGTAHVGKLLWEFCVPAVVGMFVQAIYNIVDRIYLGQGVSSLAIAAVGLIMPVMMVIAALSILIGVGANTLYALRLGEGRLDEVEKIMGHAFVLLFVVPAIGIVIILSNFNFILMRVLKCTKDMYPYAAPSFRIIMYGSIFAAMGPGLANFIRSDGHPTASMMVQIVGAGVNIILDPIMIFGMHMGVAGAAWATIIAQFLSMMFTLGYFNSKYTVRRFRFKYMKLQWHRCRQIFANGFAPFIMQFVMSLVGVFQNSQILKYGGDMGFTAMTVTFSFLSMIMMPMQGINMGAQPLIGYNYGAKQYKRVRRIYLRALGVCCVILTVGWFVTHLFPGVCFRLFSPDKGALRDLGERTIMICTLMFPILPVQMVSSGLFQSIGKPVQSTIISMSRQFLFFIPMMYFLPMLWPHFGFAAVEGCYWSFPLSDFCSVILSGSMAMAEIKKQRKLMLATPNQRD